MTLPATALIRAAGIEPAHALQSVLSGRADIFEMTARSEDAALMPHNPGGLSYAERAALACRMARINEEPGSQLTSRNA